MNSFVCTSCYEEKPNSQRWKPNNRKCRDCKLAYQKEQNKRGRQNEPAWDVELSKKWRKIYEQRELTKAKAGIISAILRIVG